MQPSLSGESQEALSLKNLESVKQGTTRSKNIKNILVILKILAGLALLILSVSGIQFENLAAGIRSANLSWLALAVLSILLGLGLKLWRWLALLRNYHIRSSLARLFSAYFVGQSANIVFPLRSGELVRLGYFTQEKSILPEAASTIILEKYLDLAALTVCCILVSINISLDNILNFRGFLLPVTIVVTLILLSVIFLGPLLWKKTSGHKLLPEPLTAWLDRLVQASQWLRNPSQLIPALLLTILIWGVMWLTNLLLFKSLGLPLGGIAGGLVLVMVYIGLLPALMPGNIGPFYFFARLALIPFGVIPNQAIVFAVVLHALVTLPPLLAGAFGLIIHSPPPIEA